MSMLRGRSRVENAFDQFDTVKLKQIGCSNSDHTITVGEARNPPPNLNWFAEFGSALLLSPLPQTLIVTLVVYVVIRAIGWALAASRRREGNNPPTCTLRLVGLLISSAVVLAALPVRV